MKGLLIIALFCCSIQFSLAQSTSTKRKNPPTGRPATLSAGFNIPLGEFSSTHFGGIGIDYSRSNHRFGKLTTVPVKKFGFMFEGGIAYYFGKKETVSGYPYDYPGYTLLQLHPGVIYNHGKTGNISLTAGPGWGWYNGNSRFTTGIKLQGTYYIKEEMGITAGILFMKESGADPIGAATLKAIRVF